MNWKKKDKEISLSMHVWIKFTTKIKFYRICTPQVHNIKEIVALLFSKDYFIFIVKNNFRKRKKKNILKFYFKNNCCLPLLEKKSKAKYRYLANRQTNKRALPFFIHETSDIKIQRWDFIFHILLVAMMQILLFNNQIIIVWA